jgi:hypothetical protein
VSTTQSIRGAIDRRSGLQTEALESVHARVPQDALELARREITMATTAKQTGKAAAKTASKLLRSPSTPAPVRKVAASDLAQAPYKSKKKPG